MARSLETYREHICGQSRSTQNMFHHAHKSFPGLEEMIASNPGEEEIYDSLQRWINSCSLNPATVRMYFGSIKQYMHYRGIKLHPLDIKQTLKFPLRYEEELHPLSIEELTLLLRECDHKRRILYMAQASSGMRIGELVRLRRVHLDTSMERIMVKIPATFTKRRRGRTTFFSREASTLLLPRLENMAKSDLLFGTSENPDTAVKTEIAYMERLVRRVDLGKKYDTNRRLKITTHSFRAYFITRVSRTDPNLAKLFAGQKGYLLQYDRLADEEKLEHYLKMEPDLLVYELTRNKVEIKKLKEEVREIDTLKSQNVHLLDRLQGTEELVEKLYDMVNRDGLRVKHRT